MRLIVQLGEGAEDLTIMSAIRLFAGVLDVAVDGAKQTKQERNLLLEALGELDCPATSNLTQPEWKRVATALATIQESCPGVTPEEIRKRAENYRKTWPNITLTSTALAAHWGRFSTAVQPKAPNPHWKVVAALKEKLARHPANPQWVGYVRGSETKEQIDEYKSLKARIEEMERQP